MTREEEEKRTQARGLRHNLYEHINLSLRTVDIIIAVLTILIIALIILGVSKK
jgi:hypothetical protein